MVQGKLVSLSGNRNWVYHYAFNQTASPSGRRGRSTIGAISVAGNTDRGSVATATEAAATLRRGSAVAPPCISVSLFTLSTVPTSTAEAATEAAAKTGPSSEAAAAAEAAVSSTSISTAEAAPTFFVQEAARWSTGALAFLPVVADATATTSTAEAAAATAAAVRRSTPATIRMREAAGRPTIALPLLPIEANAATTSATASSSETTEATATTTAKATSGGSGVRVDRDAARHLLCPFFPLALIVHLHKLDCCTLFKGIAILDVREMAEEVLTAVARRDEAEAPVGPAGYAPRQSSGVALRHCSHVAESATTTA
eukprot:CAMPEP_0182839342 /NCGR_PEP_ID=MMETSP0006_2-20121128/23814_1 /TAXON_ID=97485 /ORGANISM="Prymnesium parvum, Strain Texoma1" /LENGTH=313 /DNA_ID=CAMNT_0024968483 /DNA_START=718 /DNA_END=1655 /DNA_ORIENTATION=+